MDAISGFDWLRDHYTGAIAVVHVGFPTPFPTRFAAFQPHDTSLKDSMSAIHQKPDFMVQACPDTFTYDQQLQSLHV